MRPPVPGYLGNGLGEGQLELTCSREEPVGSGPREAAELNKFTPALFSSNPQTCKEMTMKTLHACAACQRTGEHGANFHLVIDGQVESVRYHKVCAERLARGAPEGVVAAVEHVSESFRRRRATEEKSVRDFWQNRPRGGVLSEAERRTRAECVRTANGKAPATPIAQPSG